MRRTALTVEYSSRGRNPRYFATLCARPIYRSNKTSSSTYYSTDIRSLCDACFAIPILHTATGFRCKVWWSHNPYGTPLLQQWGQQECSLYCVVEPHSFMLPVYALCIRDKGVWRCHTLCMDHCQPHDKSQGGGELRSTSPRHGIAETSFALLVWLIGDVFHKDCGSATSSGIYYSE